jgi:hypothetical protein
MTFSRRSAHPAGPARKALQVSRRLFSYLNRTKAEVNGNLSSRRVPGEAQARDCGPPAPQTSQASLYLGMMPSSPGGIRSCHRLGRTHLPPPARCWIRISNIAIASHTIPPLFAIICFLVDSRISPASSHHHHPYPHPHRLVDFLFILGTSDLMSGESADLKYQERTCVPCAGCMRGLELLL